MPQLKGTNVNVFPLSREGDFKVFTLEAQLKMDEVDSKKQTIVALNRVCAEFTKEILDHNYYFVGFYDYEFQTVGGAVWKDQTTHYKFMSLNREFKEPNMTNDERHYWGNVFTQRMVHE
ncbi:hypothetical protein LCGC14_1657780, partial [marine sediment metagenome]